MSSLYGRKVVAYKTNKSGGSVAAGDVVIIDTTNDNGFTTTTSAGSTVRIGIADETIANNATGRVVVEGHVTLVNVNASVTRGNYGKTHTVAKQATDAGASRTTGTFCQFTTGGTTPEADIFPVDLQGSVLSNPMTAVGDIIHGGTAGAPAALAIGTAAYGLVSTGTDTAWAEILPWHIQIVPMIATADATVGTWGLIANTDASLSFPFYQPGSTANSGAAISMSNATGVAQNDAWAIDVVLAKGTWDCHLWVRKSTNTGIVTLNQDGASQGTVDTYAAAAAASKVSVTGWSVAATGKKRMQLLMATKNASSTNYVLTMYGIEFRRTA